MLSAKFKPKRTAAASRGFLATARFSCYYFYESMTEKNKKLSYRLETGRQQRISL